MLVFTVKNVDVSSLHVGRGYQTASVVLQQKLELVSFRYSCRDLIFEDTHPLSKIHIHGEDMSCESRIEKSYYNIKERALKLREICI